MCKADKLIMLGNRGSCRLNVIELMCRKLMNDGPLNSHGENKEQASG